MKGYLNIDGHEYYGYDVLCRATSWYIGRTVNSSNVAIDKDMMKRLRDGDLFDSTTPIPDGASLHIVQPCPIPNDDIRKRYKIKRSIDTGDFNVFPKISKWTWYIFENVIISEKARNIILSERVYTGQKHDDAVTYTNVRVYFMSLSDQWCGLLDGTLKKPCVSYRRLSVKGSNQLTPDMLHLLYMLGTKQASLENIEKFKLQLTALNQTNWKDYPNSVRDILAVARLRGSCAYHVCMHKSERKKATEQFYCIEKKDYTDEDFNMTRDTLALILDINDTMYVKLSDVLLKIGMTGVRYEYIEKFFGGIVQLKRKERLDA